jgi:hypothetical protein
MPRKGLFCHSPAALSSSDIVPLEFQEGAGVEFGELSTSSVCPYYTHITSLERMKRVSEEGWHLVTNIKSSNLLANLRQGKIGDREILACMPETVCADEFIYCLTKLSWEEIQAIQVKVYLYEEENFLALGKRLQLQKSFNSRQ